MKKGYFTRSSLFYVCLNQKTILESTALLSGSNGNRNPTYNVSSGFPDPILLTSPASLSS